MSCDVLIAGAGGAGLTAAATIASKRDDCSVVVLEKDLDAATNSEIASNFIPAAGTRFQAAAGIVDNAQSLAQDIARKNRGRSDAELTYAICSNSAAAIHWMCDALGVSLELAPELEWIGHSVCRMHAHPTRGGPPVMAQLQTYATSRPNLTLLDRAPLTAILRADDTPVEGVIAGSGADAKRIRARAVVLATGGFNASPELVAKYLPDMANAPNIGAKTDTGDGLLLGIEAGADTRLMTGYQGRDCISADGTRVTPPVLNEGGIAINANGVRFVNERRDYSELARVYRGQPGQYAIFVWDSRIQAMVANVFVMQQAKERGGILEFEDLQTLCEHYRLPAKTVANTLATYNATSSSSYDDFGRHGPASPLQPPFYTARITGAVAHTQGGLRVDTSCRVLNSSNQVIPGLFAGGNTIAGLSGDDPAGYLSGNGLLVAYTSGFMIGNELATTL